MSDDSLFRGFLMGGFECASNRRSDGRRLDLTASTEHDRFAREDYRALAAQHILTARDGLRWHLIEQQSKHGKMQRHRCGNPPAEHRAASDQRTTGLLRRFVLALAHLSPSLQLSCV